MSQPTPTTNTANLREMLIAAAVAATAEVGYADLTVDRIIRHAGATPASFYSHFADEQAAVKEAYQSLFDRYLDRLLQACKAQSRWPLKVKVGIGVSLDMAAASPVDAQFLVETIVGRWGFPSGMIDTRDRLARLLVAGRTETQHGAELPRIFESAVIGGMAGVISSQLRAGEAKHLPALAPQFVELTLTPYLGREEAVEVARRPRPDSPDR